MEFAIAELFAQFLSSSPSEAAPDPATDSDPEVTPEAAPASDLPLLTVAQITQALGLEHEPPESLAIALDALVRIGFLATGEGPEGQLGYRRLVDEKLVVGQLRCSSKGFCFAIRDEPGVDDIYIHGTNLNGAWNGDKVLAKVVKEGNRRRSPEGQVAAVIDRANPTVVAQLKQEEGQPYKAVPLDDRLLCQLELDPGDSAADLAPGRFVYVEVDRYPLAQIPPHGLVRKVLGSSDDTSMDVDLVCCKHDLPQQFSEAVLAAASKIRRKLTKTDLKKRQDYREWPTLVITPASGPAELAFSLQPLSDQTWQLAIHITDVAHLVERDHPVDVEAQQRGVAAHLDTLFLPLFPAPVLAAAGLVPGEDCPTISVIFAMTAAGEVQSFETRLGVIQPQHHLSEAQAAALLANPSAVEGSEAAQSLLQRLHHLTLTLRQQRQAQGGWDLPAPPPVALPMDDRHGSVLGLQGFATAQVDNPVTDTPTLPSLQPFMAELQVLANGAIARHLQALGGPGLYRVCPCPTPEAIQSFLRLATNMSLGLELPADEVTTADLQRFAQRLVSEDLVSSGSHYALARQLINCLPAAQSSPTPAPHCGLGFSVYCHATAPLHRFADLTNQRLLHALLTKGRDRRSSRSKTTVDLGSSSCHGQINWSVLPPKLGKEWEDHLSFLAEHLNDQQSIIQQAEAELLGLKKSAYMQAHANETVGGLIIGVQNYGLFVQTDPVQAEGLVHVSSLKDDWYEYRSRQQALVGRKNRQQFRLGDRVEVQVRSVDYYRQQIDLAVVGEGKVYDEDED